MTSRRPLLAAMAAVIALTSAATADATSPYFRFRSHGQGDDQTSGNSLAFAAGAPLPSGAVGTPVNAVSFKATGGQAPYSMALLQAPAGITFSRVSGDTFLASGTLLPAGTFASALVRLTDAAGNSVDYPVPLTVTTAQPAGLGFAAGAPLPSGTLGTSVSPVTFSASGGSLPYTMTLLQAPAGITLSRVDATTYAASGTLTPVGDFSSAVVHLADAAGASVDYPVGLTVTIPQPPAALAMGSGDPLPSGVVQSPVRHAYYTATGGTGPYTMSLAGAPSGIALSQVASNTWEATGVLNPVGTYQSAAVTLTDATGTSVPFAVPLTVTAPASPLAFTQTADLPASFPAVSQQTAAFAVSGGAAPYTWQLAGAPGTVLASGNGDGTGQVVASVETPGTYSGATVTVTDAQGTSVPYTLAPFTVTAGAPGLVVSGLQPPPATMKVGDSVSTSFQVSGTTGPDNFVTFTPYGGGYDLYGYQNTSYSPDPQTVGMSYVPSQPGTYDLSFLLQDADNANLSKLVHWGTVTVTGSAVADTQFQTPLTGMAGTTTTVTARLKGIQGSASLGVSAPAAVTASATWNSCNNYWNPCSNLDASIPAGDTLAQLAVTFPPAGTYQGVQVVATDGTGAKVFFEPVTVVSTAPTQMAIVSQFTPNPLTATDGIYGGVSVQATAVVTGGTPNDYFSVSDPNQIGVYAQYLDCTGGGPALCNGLPAGQNVVILSGYVTQVGTFGNIVVTGTDPNGGSTVRFAPVTVTIAPPPLTNCQFAPLNATSDKASTVNGAVTFTGGAAPFTVTETGVDGITYGADTGTDGVNHSIPANLSTATQDGTANVTVKDATGASCTGTSTTQNHAPNGGQAPQLQVLYDVYDGVAASELVTSVSGQTITANLNSFSGPVGVHPVVTAVHLGFVLPSGATPTGVSLASVDAPQGILLYDPGVAGAEIVPVPGTLYEHDLQGTGLWYLPSGSYTYTYYIYLADGTYLLSQPFTTVIN